MTSDHVHALLPAYRDDDLEPARRAEVAGHLETCPTCREELTRYDQALDALAGLAGRPTDVAHVDAVMARLDELPAAPADEPERRPLVTHLVAALLGAAACLLLLPWLQGQRGAERGPGRIESPVVEDGTPADPATPRVRPEPQGQGPLPIEADPERQLASASPAPGERAAEGTTIDEPAHDSLAASDDEAPAVPVAPTLVWRFDEAPVVAVLQRLEDRLDAWLTSRPTPATTRDAAPLGSASPALVAHAGPPAGSDEPDLPTDLPGDAPPTAAPDRLALAEPPEASPQEGITLQPTEGPRASGDRPRTRRTVLAAHAAKGPRARRAGLRADTKLSPGRPAPLTVVNDDELGMTHMVRHESLALVVPSLLVTLREGTPREADLAAAALEDLRDRLLADPALAPRIRAAAEPPPAPEPSWLDTLLGLEGEQATPDARQQQMAQHDRWWTAVRDHLNEGL